MAKRHRVSAEVVAGADILPNPMDEAMLGHLEQAAADLGASSLRMRSGAGHAAA